MKSYRIGLGVALLATALAGFLKPAHALDVDKRLLEVEKKRTQLIEQLKPAVVSVMGRDPRTKNVIGLGSGVLIDEEGYALTNFHVVSAFGYVTPVMQCGLPDGKLYDCVLVGLDPIGDISLIKLLPATPGQKFPVAKIGDSDQVKPGEWTLLMGNPFALATDFQPTVTHGIISATQRYINIGKMEYTNCLQVDTSSNPGNSGGPLFNNKGELIGILSAGNVNRRRGNCGAGFCVSINQVKNFLPGLRSGLLMDHATLGATMESESDEGSLSRVLVRNVIQSDAQRRGLEPGDQLVAFAGRPVFTVNAYKNLLGQFPRGWRVPMTYRRESTRVEALVRLMGATKRTLEEPKGPAPKGPPRPAAPPPSGPAAKFYVAKKDFANYYFNEQAQKAALAKLAEFTDFSKSTGDWNLKIGGKLLTGITPRAITGAISIRESGAADGKSPKVLADIDGLDFPLEPLSTKERAEAFTDPPESGGFVLAMYHWRQFLVHGAKGFDKDSFFHAGVEPFFPPLEDKPNYMKSMILAETFHTKFAGVEGRFYLAPSDNDDLGWKKGQLIGMEIFPDKDQDPCEIVFTDYKDIGGKTLPGRMHVRRGMKKYADFTITTANLK
jgi:S1-C subfamily serine protease